MVLVNILNTGDTVEVESGTTLLELSKGYEKFFKGDILFAYVDEEINELSFKIKKMCSVHFIDITSNRGYDAYKRSVFFLMVYAIKDLFGNKTRVTVKHSINKNHYCVSDDFPITSENLKKIKDNMKKLVKLNIPIETISVPVTDGIELYSKFTDVDMSRELKYIKGRNITLHKLNDFYDYMYGMLVKSTGYLRLFNIKKQDKGFILQFPDRKNPSELSEIKRIKKLANIFDESSEWAKILNVNSVSALNDTICEGEIDNIIRISEALHEKKIAHIADMITNSKKRIVLIAGPSSSGKTTFAKRLCIQLRVNGIKPYVISLDDYYLNRENTPLDEDGNYDFECVEALDTELLNNDLNLLLNKEVVQIPSFNFSKGIREYKGKYLRLESDEVLILEGIHGLNERLTSSIERKDKFKIYISALTQLNINRHNRIATTDARMIRRIVRDNQFRGFSAIKTIEIWPSVVRGEHKYIFPFQEEADVMFNSALVYELGVLKQFAEPLLFGIDKNVKGHSEAERLIRFLNSFLTINCENIPSNSIIREFIGGSCFNDV